MLIKNNYMFSAAISVLIAVAGQADASCPAGTTATAVKGKIFNNAVNLGATSGTLGTVQLEVGNGTKVKCGIIGTGGVGSDRSINFTHTLVCDDSLLITNPATGQRETVHSQVTLNTTGTSAFQACNPSNPLGGSYGTFEETSVPVPATGRGIFQGVTAGRIAIDGTMNCQFAIDMKFQGEICMPYQ
jgi:hypothetical protein